MGEEKKRWGWWQKVALASLSVLLIFVGILVGGRRAWIEPLPGIRIEMTRPFLRESDLGPESAYLLLLEAIEPPVEASRTRKAGKARKLTPEEELFGVVARPAEQERPIWGHDWTEALGKLAVHPWPRQPPPAPAPVEKGNVAREEAGGGMGGEFPSPVPADAPWTLAQYQDIQRLRELYEPKVAILDRALADPNPQVPTIDSWDFPLSYLSNARALTRWVALSAQCKAAEGDAIGACQDIDRALGMAGLVSRGGALINHLVGYACDAIVADAAWCSATRQDLPVSVLREMAHSFLAHADTAEPLVEAIRAEALLTVDVVREFYRQGNINLTRGFPIDPPTALERTAFSFVFLAGSTPDATARNMRACYQHLVAIVDKPYSAAVQAESDRFLRSAFQPRRSLPQIALRTRDPMGYLLARMFLPALNGGHRKAAGRDATLRGMALFCAVQAYEREHGTPPARLAQLVPEYLPHVPLDPFDGKPFRYLPASVPGLPPKAWAVYSVGEDFTDDGGTAGSVGRSRGKTGNNLDLVWPSQDYPKPPAPAPPEGVPGP